LNATAFNWEGPVIEMLPVVAAMSVPEPSVGVEPSSVKRMFAPVTAVVRVTVRGKELAV
jgi:hypothetical protein